MKKTTSDKGADGRIKQRLILSEFPIPSPFLSTKPRGGTDHPAPGCQELEFLASGVLCRFGWVRTPRI